MAAAGSGLQLEPIQGNSLTSFIRSIEGLTGQQGQTTFQSGLQTASPAIDYLTKLVKGDQGDVTQAAQPEIDQITQQFDQIRNMISLQPRGGGKTSALAEAPFQKSAAIQRTEGAMRGGAASELAGLGLQEAGLGTSLESLSSNVALTKEQQDYQQQEAVNQMLGSLGQGIGSIVGGYLAGG